jgi:siroheme synthase-like protein
MSYFPIFVDISTRSIVIIGGGDTAFRKVQVLVRNRPSLRIVSEHFCFELENLAQKYPEIILEKGSYSSELLENCFLVIAATDNPKLNARIYADANKRGVLCNAVDQPECCSVIFPALIQDPPLTVAISTQGASPKAAQYVRNLIQQELPENFSSILQWLQRMRKEIKELPVSAKVRSAINTALFETAMEKERILEDKEVITIIKSCMD